MDALMFVPDPDQIVIPSGANVNTSEDRVVGYFEEMRHRIRSAMTAE